MIQATIVKFDKMEQGRFIYGVYQAQLSRPGPALVVDLAGAEKILEIESGSNPAVAPLEKWEQKYATPDFPAVDWRRT